jgi:glycerophosphoryl diester phosphodiesterase
MELLRAVTGRVMIEGHRGAEGLAVENTWPALEAGYAAGADWLEIDIQRARDGTLVIYHSYTLPDGRWVRDLEWDELSRVRPKGHGLIRLEEAFEWLSDKPVRFTLDFKNGFGFDRQVFFDALESVKARGLEDRVMFTGWDHGALLACKQRHAAITTLALLRARPVDVVQVVHQAQADAVNLDADMVQIDDVERLHAEGLAVVIADMFDADFRRAIRMGADIICCKDPGQAKAVIDEVFPR